MPESLKQLFTDFREAAQGALTGPFIPQGHSSLWKPELMTGALEELLITIEELQIVNEELVATRQAVEAERQRYQDLFEFAPDGYLVTNLIGTIQEANRAAARLLHRSQEHLVGKPFVNFIPVAERRAFRSQLTRLNQEGAAQEWQVRLQLHQEPHGSQLGAVRMPVVDVVLTVAVVRDADNQPTSLRWLLHDVSDRQPIESQVRTLNAELEQRVIERTTDLTKANAELRAEISDRQRAESALRQSEEQLRLITDALPVLISYIDAEQRYRFNNRAYEQWFGLSRTEITGQHIKKILGESIYQIIQRHVEAALSGQRVTYESFVPYRDGGIRYINGVFIPHFGGQVGVHDPPVQGFIALISDITERKQAEEVLLESQQLLELFFSQSLDGFFFMMLDEPVQWNDTVDKDKVLDYVFAHQHVTKVNEAILAQYGASQEQFMGLTPNDLFAHDLAHGKDIWRRFFDAGRLHVETDERKFDGSPMRIEGDYLCLYDSQGRIIGHFGVQRDITKRKQAEEALRQAKDEMGFRVAERTVELINANRRLQLELDERRRAKEALEQLSRQKDKFISEVSHELRTPLTSVNASLGMLASGLLQAEPQTSQRLLEIAVSSTERLVRLINGILDIERVESGKVPMEKQACDAANLMTKAVDEMRGMAETSGVTLSVLPLSAQLWADPDRIIQILTNLLSNAIKFSAQGTHVRLMAEPQGAQIQFQVKDQGRGIPAEKLETIFERFQQVDAADSHNCEGTGLGLAICRSIVQQHEGHIWAESTLGEGSIFYFTLPI